MAVATRPDIDFHDLERFPRECREWFRWLRAHDPMSFHPGPPFQPEHDGFWSLVLYDDLAGSYVLAAVLTATGVIALILCGAGVYGIVSQGVVQRRREIGVRIALGARPGDVVRMVVADGTRPVVAGGAVGLIVAIALALATAALLSILDARDPISYAGVLSLTGVVAVGAALLPALQAAHVDPMEALRVE